MFSQPFQSLKMTFENRAKVRMIHFKIAVAVKIIHQQVSHSSKKLYLLLWYQNKSVLVKGKYIIETELNGIE